MGSFESTSVRLQVSAIRLRSASTTSTCNWMSWQDSDKCNSETYPTLYASAWLEALLRMLQDYVGVVVRPNHAVNIARNGDKQCRVGQLLDRSLDDLPDLHFRDLQELLLQGGWTHRELEEAIKRVVAGDTRSVCCSNLPRA